MKGCVYQYQACIWSGSGFEQMLDIKGLIKNKGKDSIHKELTPQLLENLQLSEETAMVCALASKGI